MRFVLALVLLAGCAARQIDAPPGEDAAQAVDVDGAVRLPFEDAGREDGGEAPRDAAVAMVSDAAARDAGAAGSDETDGAIGETDGAVVETDAGSDETIAVVIETDGGAGEDAGLDPCVPPGGVVYDCSAEACDPRAGWATGWSWCEPPRCSAPYKYQFSSSELSVLLPGDEEADLCQACWRDAPDWRARWRGEVLPGWCVRVTAPEGSVVIEYPDPCLRVNRAERCLVVDDGGTFVVLGLDDAPAGWLHLEPVSRESWGCPLEC